MRKHVTLAQVNEHMPVGAANDRVLQAQLETYLPLIPQVEPLLDGEHIDMVEHHCGLPLEVRQELRAIMNRARVKPSHRWVRGIVATYLATRPGR